MVTIDELKRYEYAPIGIEFLQAGDLRGAKNSLEKMVSNMSMDPDTRELISEMANAEGIESGLKYGTRQYIKKEKDADLNTFWQLYQEGFDKDGEKKVYGLQVSRYGNLKLKELEQGINDAQERLKDILDNNPAGTSDAEVLDLTDIINRYKQAYSLIKSGRAIRISKLKADAYSAARKEDISDIRKDARRIVGAPAED